MSLEKWLIERYDLHLEAPQGASGVPLADALCSALAAAGFDFDSQAALLLEASERHADIAFAEACLDRVERIEALQARRREALQRHQARCQAGVGRRQPKAPAPEVAVHRFVPLWPASDQSADLVDDMLRRLASEGFILLEEWTLRDLRQGLGYYRRGEDPYRLRRPARWLAGMNALHFWVELMMDEEHALISVADGSAKKWVTAASLFTDRQGHAVTNGRIEHGEVESAALRRRIERCVPKLISSEL